MPKPETEGAVFLGSYELEGDVDELLAAYDKLMVGMPVEMLTFHACVRRPGGITIYDACPDEETFRAFSSSDGLLGAFAAAGLPEPAVVPLGDVHSARGAGGVTIA